MQRRTARDAAVSAVAGLALAMAVGVGGGACGSERDPATPRGATKPRATTTLPRPEPPPTFPARDDVAEPGTRLVATADAFSCSLDRDHHVACWGLLLSLQGDMLLEALRQQPLLRLPELDGAVELAAMSTALCARFEDGRVRCAARAPGDQRRFGRVADVPLLVDANQLSGATNGFCATRRGGEAVCWEMRDDGRDSHVPTTPVGLWPELGRVVEVAAGSSMRCVRLATGAVQCARAEGGSPRLVVTGARSVSADSHACAALDDGSVWCWGLSQSRRLADGTPIWDEQPWRVRGLASHAVTVVARGANTCALDGAGGLTCWGQGAHGEVGDGGRRERSTPPAEPVLRDAVAVDIGNAHICARTRDDAVWCWGWDVNGAVTGASLREHDWSDVPAITDAIDVRVGDAHACALRRGGRVSCWGTIDAINRENTFFLDSETPRNIPGLAGATALGVGMANVCAIVAGGHVRCFGARRGGLLGAVARFDAPPSERGTATPVEVPGITGATVLDVEHMAACAVVQGTVWCWGEMLDGDFDSVVPRRLEGLSDAVDVDVGWALACSRRRDASVWCWGSALDPVMQSSRAGGGRRRQFVAPRELPEVRGALAVAVVRDHACARMPDGEVRCWGPAGPGPIAVRPLEALRDSSLFGGSERACGTWPGRPFACIGFEPSASFGRVVEPTLAPIAPASMRVLRASDDQGGTCVVLEDGRVQCRGEVRNGRLGDGSSDIVRRPRRVTLLDSTVSGRGAAP